MESPKPAIKPYTASAVATPKPEIIPDFQFLLTVLWIHNIPIGPRGMETEKPHAIPVQSKPISIRTKIEEKIIYLCLIRISIDNA